ncbi:glycosyltransferase [Xanthomonas oryzae]|uniref:glycosyltransferase n=1 Tax=Xanthomonas oryzae TaxID=347 RepID=UPI00040A7592|nr:glycosyltransferase [Xanthomonas oryzae]AUI91607.1 glycosyl transferase [Xanthomonas oryzae pv. oryzae]AUI95282.1 glycosyl transferase [Xanthomonas oryzae pv. oryzae]AUI98955.1 glycosyl transferase [Xanthomonas oryzae pv. oryzae]AUJ02632.1 glycosyl transferase [Xanthomonas oryzae pv. oryzae]AUJ06300.1 glycosyl transferase [Xanthomonas oryzae pv. oryzae]
MHRLTVVQLLPALQSGGVERSTLEIAAALVRAGHRAVVVSAGGRLVQPLLDAGGEHLTLDIGRKSLLTLRHVVGLRRLFAELDADIVHARSRLPAWLGWYALRGMSEATRPRLVTTVHGLNSPSRYSAVMTYGERVICVSQTVRDYVCTHYPQTDPTRLRTIPRGVDIAQFPRRLQPDRRARAWAQTLLPGLSADARLLLLPGRGTRLKGHADGLQLLADVRAAGVPAYLWLPGAREPGREAYLRALEADAARLGVADAIAFTEPTARIAEAYAASDLVLQLSRKPEAFGRTVVEALSVGRPVLGWAHGGVGELLAELQPGGAVAPFDAQALCAQALALLQQPPTAPAVIPYTLQAMQSATLKVYDELRR